MERKQYLNLCREISLLPQGIAGTIKRPPRDLLVSYAGTVYYPLCYKMAFHKGEYRDIAVLHDMKTNSLMQAPLKEVELYDRSSEEST